MTMSEELEALRGEMAESSVEPTEDRVNAYHQYLDDRGIVDRVSASEAYRILIPEET